MSQATISESSRSAERSHPRVIILTTSTARNDSSLHFGNSLGARDEGYAYRAIDTTFVHSYAICHVKDSIVNEQGRVEHVDLARTFGILKRHAYRDIAQSNTM
jgi:hypothetical protein